MYEILNIEETFIYLNMSTSITVQAVGSRKVSIRTQEQENWRIAVILTIPASWEK